MLFPRLLFGIFGRFAFIFLTPGIGEGIIKQVNNYECKGTVALLQHD